MNAKQFSFEELPQITSELRAEVMAMRETMEQILVMAKSSQDSNKEEMVGIDEACKILGRRKPTVYHKGQCGDLPTCRPAGCKKLMFKRSDLFKWMEECGRKQSFDEAFRQILAEPLQFPNFRADVCRTSTNPLFHFSHLQNLYKLNFFNIPICRTSTIPIFPAPPFVEPLQT